MSRITLALATVLSLSFSHVTAQDINKGIDAYKAGDYATAIKKWKPFAVLGDATLQFNIGTIYASKDAFIDYDKALKWYRLSAFQDFPNAQVNLGKMYEEGKGVPKDYATAVAWYTLAAEQELASAQYNLGQMYRKGNGVLKDLSETMKWYKLSAEQGFADAQNNIGAAYMLGEGVLKDNITAHMWFNIASANGHKKAGGWRDELSALMTADAVQKATAMARECMNSNYKKCGW